MTSGSSVVLCEDTPTFQPMASRNSANRITILTSGEMQERAHSTLPNEDDIIDFPWESSWLSGQEYHHILTHLDAYTHYRGFKKYEKKTHPLSIYTAPSNGMLYFVKGETVGSDFGFPRLGVKKVFKWKKMNFTTSLPKKNPLVSYIVASAMRCLPRGEERKLLKHRIPDYRMHAVVLHRRPQAKKHESFVLCHIRKVCSQNDQYLPPAEKVPCGPHFKSNLPSKTQKNVSFADKPILISSKSLPLPEESEYSEEMLSPTNSCQYLPNESQNKQEEALQVQFKQKALLSETSQEEGSLSTEESPVNLRKPRKLTLLKQRSFPETSSQESPSQPQGSKSAFKNQRSTRLRVPQYRVWNNPKSLYDPSQNEVTLRFPCSSSFNIECIDIIELQSSHKKEIREISPTSTRYNSESKSVEQVEMDFYPDVRRFLEF